VRVIALKLIRLVVVLLIVTFLCFLLMKLIPGDPVDKVAAFATPEQKAVIREQLGLEKPFFSQYWSWLTGFVTGDFGRYYTNNGAVGETVGSVMSQALPVSGLLLLYSQVLALAVAIPAGIFTAYKAGTKVDGAANTVAFGLLALPNFVLALVLVIYVGAQWKLLPTQWAGSPGVNPMLQWRYAAPAHRQPRAGQIAIYMRLLRTDMIDTLQVDFITTARPRASRPARSCCATRSGRRA